VLANDSDPDGDLDPFSVTIVAGPNGPGRTMGTLTVTPELGSDVVSYFTPDANGAFTFRYSVCDRARHCSTAEATIIMK